MNNWYKITCRAALFGNAIYFLWIVWNAIDEDGKVAPVEACSYVGLLLLLVLNFFLIYRANARHR